MTRAEALLISILVHFPTYWVFKNPKSEMSTKKVFKKNIVSKFFIFLFSPILKKYYVIYEDVDKIVLLKKGKVYRKVYRYATQR
jgi:hypothetical protein